jgi:phosphopantetheine adenylyltransferase
MHLLVVANETVTGRKLIEAIERHVSEAELRVSVICPVSQPQRGYVVYQDTRRAAASRRLDRTVSTLRDEGIPADGFVVEADPVTAVRDAVAQLEPRVDAIIVATHPVEKSGWLRKNVIDKIRDAVGSMPLEHVVVDIQEEGGPADVLVVANQTMTSEELLNAIRERAAQGAARFVLIEPQSDPTQSEHPDAERRLRRALAELRGAGIEAHGWVAHPDPFEAAMQEIEEERIDEIIVSTFEPEQSGWLRKDLIERLRQETNLPVTHIMPKKAAPA